MRPTNIRAIVAAVIRAGALTFIASGVFGALAGLNAADDSSADG